ncbi:energy-coupling factor ABC transporter permease [Hydrogenibacillus schlegelii]|uniref:Cobalamin biosynthesis protein CbiM n=1 Tax=Hydrogenibacillus schlegelii TaxID=1484 RepID=A0A132MGH1_HYDSH|nr:MULTISPECIES: energy-coupling factor ABC transporter permease [Hydrogenibacillus]KWW96928.1 cobalamin biosynthesis protein CbiM [Hydrogenibacillus schlegelii]MBT9282924.1 energy-coupling factor ABC transporter permease [Hydrogenibacillus schlegelii]MBT9283243.1 energy-coupling factor ABC transporter permease [Hydrogenibacillus schlegelii]OAR05484.1 cobalamin biosynthesis protein CbiM [Hydrogenibacillus schlegelii]PTQ54075.1 MAG: Substrate-specific component NikM of nickel ECF transporter [H
MHVPDGLLSPPVVIGTNAVSLAVLAQSVRAVRRDLEPEKLPAMGAAAAFLFAAQMVNFPLLGAATSGHLIGGAFAAILFGFYPATLIMAVILFLQAILFQDGGITALGLNILAMGIVAPLVGRAVYGGLSRLPDAVRAFVASWLSVEAGAFIIALMLGLSGVVPYGPAIATLLFWHAWIGIGEGLITAVILPFARRSAYRLVDEA